MNVINFARNRLDAIKVGRSIAGILKSANEGMSMDTIKLNIDQEIQAAKDAGLNFNTVCK